MWVRLLSITSLFLGLMLLVCKLPSPPPGPENSYVALEFKSSSGKITKDTLTDSIGKQVNICMIHNLTQYIDSSVLKITRGADFNAIHQIRSFKGQLDTTYYPVVFSVPGSYAVIFIGYIQGQTTVLNGTITIMGQQTTQNQKPVLSVLKEVKTGVGQELVIPVSATDPDVIQQVTITVIKKPESATFNANLFKWTPALADTGSVTIKFTATDNGSPVLSVTDSCVIVVSATPVNRAPQWSIKSIQRSTLPEVPFSLDVSSYCIDLDNDNLTFSLLTKAPAKDTIAGNLYQFTPTVSDTGVHTISIVASDPAGLTDTLTLDLTISTTIISKPDIVPPVITIRSPSNDTVISVDSFELKVTCVDDSGCSVSGYCDGKDFTMVKVPSVPNLWTGMVKGLTSGSFATIKIIATDSSAARNSDSTTIQIKYDGDSTTPTLTRVIPASESASTNASSYTITVNCTDASGVASVVGTMGKQTFTGTKGAVNAWTIAVTGLSSTAANAIVITATDSSLRANKSTLDFSITSDPTMLDTIGPTITDVSGPVSGSIVTEAVVDIVKEISDPNGIDSVYWTKNGGAKKVMSPVSGNAGHYSLKDTLTEGRGDTLVITVVDKATRHNRSTQTVILRYVVTPSIKAQPYSQTVCIDNQATFLVAAIGTAPLTYQWRTGTGPFVKIGGNHPACSLSVTSTTIISCIISNGSGVDVISDPCTLTVTTAASKPVVGATPLALCSGSSTLLSATGDPGTGGKWVWYSSKTGAALTSLSVYPTTSAWYFVRSEGGNCGNSAWDSVQITVNSAATKPVLEASSATSCSGDPVTLKVVSGNPGTNGIWAWYTDAAWSSTSKVGTGVSIDVYPTSTTTYYVRAEGGTCPNTAATASIAITVNSRSVAPTSITSSENPVCSGSSVTLTVTDGVLGANASWQWYTDKDCTNKATGTRGGLNGSTLTTTINARISFYVRAEGGCNGNTDPAYTTVAVVTPITFTTNPESVSMCNDASWANFSLYASGGGTPQLNYQWKRNGVVITDGTNYKNTKTRSLDVLASEYTTGDYTCTVDNGNGCSNTSAPAALSLEYSHLTILTPMNGSATEGSLAGCDVTVTGGSGNYTYQWYKDDVALSPDPDRQFDPYSRTWYIVPVEKSDAGRYSCRVRDADIPGCPAMSGYSTLTVTDSNP